MAKRQKSRSKKERRVPKGCPFEEQPVPKKAPKPSLVERTDSKGLVELKFPGFEATFPGTNRSTMVIIVAGICALVIIFPVCFYLVFSADPRALESVGHLLSSENKPREPMKVPVRTEDGIEVIEVCPPCEDWSIDQCEERYGACGIECPVCPVCQTCPPPAPPAMVTPPQKGDAPLKS
jgi:hypothetical protein